MLLAVSFDTCAIPHRNRWLTHLRGLSVATSPRKVILTIALLAEDFRLQHNRTEVMQSISSFPKSLALYRILRPAIGSGRELQPYG